MDSSPTQSESSANFSTRRRNSKRRAALWFAAVFALLVLGVFIGSFFLDGTIRPRLEAKMNSSLKGYHVTLGSAHVQPIGLRLTLKNLTIAQHAHPAPPVAHIALIRFHLYWRELLSGHVAATVEIRRPVIHINRPQLTAEAKNRTPIRQRGWQDALQAVYPFKINRLSIRDGEVTYIDKTGAKPIHLENLEFVSDNIRNIREPNNVYPSTFRANLGVFGRGRLELDGRANFLMEPYPGIETNYEIKNVPLQEITPASRHVNLMITGGVLSSEGFVEYSPKVTAVQVRNAAIDSVDLTYVHTARTRSAEEQRVTRAGRTVEKVNNNPTVLVDVRQLEIRNSRVAYRDEAANPNFLLFISGANISITNLTNHGARGRSHVDLSGKFMDSGDTRLVGTFVAAGSGPEFAVNIAIINVDLTALNPLLRAQGKVEVAQGDLSVYSQIAVKNAAMSGYVKPIFSNLKVYGPEREKNKSFFHKAKEAVIGAAAHVFKNQKTQKVATQVSLNGTLTNPKTSTWEAFVEVVRNAFVKAILPGFDRQMTLVGGPPAKPPNG